jgi:hypothetical protein
LNFRFNYFTNRPSSAAAIVEDVASREWLSCDPWTYPHGDYTALCANELNQVARPVYEFLKIKTRHHGDVNKSEEEIALQRAHKDATFERLMETFNVKVSAWGNDWAPLYAACTLLKLSRILIRRLIIPCSDV